MLVAKCSFCGEKLEEGTGKMLVLRSNKILYFCKKKCEKNWGMGRNPKKMKWTETHRKLKQK